MNSSIAAGQIPLLGTRYLRNTMASVTLNDVQTKARDEVLKKIDLKIYPFESAPCCVCAGNNFAPLAYEDRYGVPTPVVLCLDCGLVQTNPRLTESAYAEFYSHEYRRFTHGRNVPVETVFQSERERGRQQFDWLRQTGLLKNMKEEKLALEIGCGSGGILQYFKEQNWRIKGIDIDPAYIEYGKRHGLDLSIQRIDELEKEQADLIILSHSLEHLSQPQTSLKQIHQLLFDTGLLFIEVPGIKNLWPAYVSDFQRYIQCAHTYHFSLATLVNLVEQNGFQKMVGNETVRAVFRKRTPSAPKPSRVNDADSVLNYLHSAERKRKMLSPFSTPLIHLAGWFKRRRAAIA